MEDGIQLGNEAFNKMLFILNSEITEKNHRYYKYDDEEMQEIAEDVWAMPAFMKEDVDFTLFFIITKISTGETTVAFSKGELSDGDFQLSQPFLTGEGLNMLYQHSQKDAEKVLHFINQISKANEGQWRMVEGEE
ncbi:hypothetical protein GSH19_00890 [Lactobacillus sp. S2-2]|uniref:hypothetical protein n=1 Tax=Lactobacillus sp. S2-2 TaxID=2692917 RepID=UPI001F2262AB|nr:hypothetical protein [Lactobacillus sp. S2-2]MCF6514744.1 hypothetical protein [Lactobacillus sp. S2-2]